MFGRLAFIFFLMLGCQISVMAQRPTSPELAHIRLSGLTGSPDHRLAVINGKSFSPGEANFIKLAGKTVPVKCLEIGETSVIVQIGDLASRYRLTMGGEISALDDDSATAPTSQPVIENPSPTPAATSVAKPYVPRPWIIPSPPKADSRNFFLTPISLIFGAVVIFLSGIALGFGVDNYLYRKNVGEAQVAETIHRHFNAPHHLLNNLTLPTADGTTQIDHVLVAATGVFVIETKHYSGWIFGNPQDSQWTQQIFRTKNRFQNPLRQNFAHVKALQSLFELPDDHFHSVVVFTHEAEFKTDLGPNVLQLGGLIPFLTAERPALLDERQMALIVGRIEMKRNRRSVETDEYHINHVRRKIAGKIHPQPKSKVSPFAAPPASAESPSHPHAKYLPKK